jgi:hypothetical protein
MTSDWPKEAERQLLAAACRDDFELFARLCLGFTHKNNQKGAWWDDAVHKPLCQWFQARTQTWLATRHTERRRTYLAVLIPRGCAKSLLITRAGMLWLHLHDPNLSTYIGNEKLELAEDFLSTIKRWLEGSRDKFNHFNWLYGIWKSDLARWRADSITHAACSQERTESSFGVWSPNSALTGRHPDILCMDDLVSYDALKKDLGWFQYAYAHMTDLIPVVEPNGLVLLVGTRYGDGDPFGRCFTTQGIANLSGMTDFDDEYKVTPTGRWNVFFWSGRTKDGKPAVPTVWPESEMHHLEITDPVKYASQVLNRPKAHKLRPLTEHQFDSMVSDKLPKKAGLFLLMDTAFKSSKKMASGSETALCICAHDEDSPGRVTVVEAISSLQFRADTFSTRLLDELEKWSARYPIIALTDENESAGKIGLWEQFLSDRFTDRFGDTPRSMPTFFAIQRQKGESKEVRISNAIGFVINGQVQFHKDCQDLDKLRNQLTGHPHAFPNDLADCFADNFIPEIFSGLLPRYMTTPDKQPLGAYEANLKPRWFTDSGNMDDMEFDREPIGRGALRPGASPDR